MTDKRFTIIQDGDNFTVRDNLKNRPMGMFEFKGDEFPVYFCFHKIIDLLNELDEENIELHIQNDFLKDENQHMRDLVNENKLLKEKLNEILELTEMTGMIHLRKAEIKSIIKR